jgi:hypothetical protein
LELTLNLAWMVLSAALIAACRRNSKADRRAVGVIALVCLIAILFPIVSITDDLHGGALFADSKLKRFSAELAAMVTAAFVSFANPAQHAQYAIFHRDRPRTREPFSVHLNRRPPPELS